MAHLAQFNIARLTRPMDDPANAEFMAALDPINALAESTPGFVWRLTDDDGASAIHVELPGTDDPNLVINYSIWEDLESLKHFVTRSGHATYLRRRRDWFEPATEAVTVCWWIAEGERPPVSEAMERLDHLRANGPSSQGWPMNKPLDPPADL